MLLYILCYCIHHFVNVHGLNVFTWLDLTVVYNTYIVLILGVTVVVQNAVDFHSDLVYK